MAQKYAKDQPSGYSNRIERVAIVGAGGLMGKYITEELLKTGKHTITALSRKCSTITQPEGVKVAHIDYNDESTLVTALQGQQFLIITLSVMVPRDTESKLIQAAAKAGVAYIMSNCYGIDLANRALSKDMLTGERQRAACDEIAATGVSSWVALVCSLWYEYSLITGPEWFGFNFKDKTLTLYDDGNTKINTTTWNQCGRAVAALLSLPILPETSSSTPTTTTLTTFLNAPLYISSFLLSQRDMFASWKRITGDTDADWTIEHEATTEQNQRGLDIFQNGQGDRRGFALAVFSRIFYPNGDGDYESKYGLANEALGLPREELDERTRWAKGRLDSGYSYLTRS